MTFEEPYRAHREWSVFSRPGLQGRDGAFGQWLFPGVIEDFPEYFHNDIDVRCLKNRPRSRARVPGSASRILPLLSKTPHAGFRYPKRPVT